MTECGSWKRRLYAQRNLTEKESLILEREATFARNDVWDLMDKTHIEGVKDGQRQWDSTVLSVYERYQDT